MLMHPIQANLVQKDPEYPKGTSKKRKWEVGEAGKNHGDVGRHKNPTPFYIPSTPSRGAVNPQQDHQTYQPSSPCKHKTKLTVSIKKKTNEPTQSGAPRSHNMYPCHPSWFRLSPRRQPGPCQH